jgi:hypothetical protein
MIKFPPLPAGYDKRRLEEILERVRVAINAPKSLPLAVLYTPPAVAADGTVVYADGTKWNPGAGRGFYGYHNGAWVKLHA